METILLELLSNELLLDIFEYLSTVHLLRSFYNLNNHFNNLIFRHFKTHSLNFQSSLKSDFSLICEKYLPVITNRIISLRLSDDDDTPKQIDLFFSYGLSFQQFSYLQSLSIHQIYSLTSLTKIIEQLIYLPHLIHLKITRYFLLYDEFYDIGIINSINHLSKLIDCCLDITNDSEHDVLIPSIISSSLKSLSIPYLNSNRNQLINLIKYIPNLHSLNTYIIDYLNESQTSLTRFLSIKKLNLRFNGLYNSLKHLLEMFPNLEELKIEMTSNYINGYQWEEIIENNLLFLINFQFKMSFSLSNENNLEEIINSFSTSFWIEKHQWFIQCYYNITDISSIIYIYTLPYSFPNFLYLDNDQIESRCLINYSFDYVKNLYYNNINLSLSDIYFNNIRYLDLTFPFSERLWLIIKKFNRLKSLRIVLIDVLNENDLLKLQILFDRLISLQSVIFFTWSIENIFPFNLKNLSIRQLDLRSPNLYYNSQQCKKLIQSSIGQQCEILFINILERLDILEFISNMNNLRSLIINCLSEKSENLIQWLEQSLLLTCTQETNHDDIRLWIR